MVTIELIEQPSIAELEARLKKADAEAGRLRAALEMVEWADTMMGHPNCPWCHAYENEPHEPDCARQVALGHAEQDGGKD